MCTHYEKQLRRYLVYIQWWCVHAVKLINITREVVAFYSNSWKPSNPNRSWETKPCNHILFSIAEGIRNWHWSERLGKPLPRLVSSHTVHVDFRVGSPNTNMTVYVTKCVSYYEKSWIILNMEVIVYCGTNLLVAGIYPTCSVSSVIYIKCLSVEVLCLFPASREWQFVRFRLRHIQSI